MSLPFESDISDSEGNGISRENNMISIYPKKSSKKKKGAKDINLYLGTLKINNHFKAVKRI
jgi:hypothetical protein